MNSSVFRQVRYSLYAAFVLSGVILQWCMRFPFRCHVTGERCFACGLRAAVDAVLQGNFREAYQSNKLIAVVILVAVFMAADVARYLGMKFFCSKGTAIGRGRIFSRCSGTKFQRQTHSEHQRDTENII